MSNETATKTAKPTHRAYITSGQGDKTKWTEIGAAWPHKDGKGFTIDCAAVPITGRLVVRAIQPKAADAGKQGALV